MLIFGSASASFISWCTGVVSLFGNFSLFILARAEGAQHSCFYCPRTPNMPSARFHSTGHMYTCHQTAGLCGQRRPPIIFKFHSATGFWLSRRSSVQISSLNLCEWLSGDLLRGNMLPGGQRHTLFMELMAYLYPELLWLLVSLHGNEKKHVVD